MTLRIKLLLSGFLVVALLASHFAFWQWGQARATHKTAAACQQGHINQLSGALQKIQALTDEAAVANLALHQTISHRIEADAQTAGEIRRALSTTAHLRVDCVLPDSVMRQLSAARDRANQAATAGFGHAVPAAPAPDG